MKGTATRGSTPEEDAQIAQTLQSSDKNRAENLMIVDLIRNDLGRLSAPGQVKVTELFSLETYSTVFQLTSSIEAREVDASLREIFAALFPCGSITGAPKLRAMQIIDELEAAPRGIYCGALGWIAPDGDARFNIPIRTLELRDDGQCRLDVGSGIVADSEADAEYTECLAKARFAMPDDLQLIETLRCERDDKFAFPLLALHLERLARSAHALHFACDIAAIEAALNAHAATLTAGTYRVRLLLSRDGRHQVTSATLDALPPAPTIILADFRLDPADPRLRHKTTARHFYDSSLQAAMAAGHIDALFLNTRGELCEGARSNLFIERGGKLLTPALQCGLLPGVLRAQLLASGEAKEAVLRQEDLMRADRILVGNALRGLTTVELR